MLHMSLGVLLSKKRKELKLTVQSVADTLQLTQGYVSNIESGKRVPSLHVLHQFAQLYDLDVLVLLHAADYLNEKEYVKCSACNMATNLVEQSFDSATNLKDITSVFYGFLNTRSVKNEDIRFIANQLLLMAESDATT